MSEEAVYRIYRNGKPYKSSEAKQNIKAVYVKPGAAKSVITNEVYLLAKDQYEKANPGKRYWNLYSPERNAIEASIRLEFEVVTYVPDNAVEFGVICDELDQAKALLHRLHEETMDPQTQLEVFESGLIE